MSLVQNNYGSVNVDTYLNVDFSDVDKKKLLEDMRESELYHELSELSKNKLEAIRKVITAVHDEKWRYDKRPKYGNLSKAMSKEKLARFFSSIRNPDVKREFLLEFFYALRVGEVEDIWADRKEGIVVVNNKKCKRIDYLPLYYPASCCFDWVDDHGTISSPHSKDYLRKCFRSIRDDAGLDFVYAKDKRGHDLYLYTPHSLRHSAIQIFRKHTKDPLLYCTFSRHVVRGVIGEAATYAHASIDELRDHLEECFREYECLLNL